MTFEIICKSPPKALAKHPLKDPDHPNQGGVQPGVLPIDGDDEEVHVVAVVPEALHQFTNYVSVGVVGGIIEADGVDDTENRTHISKCDALAYLYLMGFSLSPLKKASAKLVDWVQDTASADTGKISAS